MRLPQVYGPGDRQHRCFDYLKRTDKSSPIYGMPILNADHAKSVIALKRSMAAGFAGIENELFYNPKTSMLFGDAKKSLTGLVAEVKNA